MAQARRAEVVEALERVLQVDPPTDYDRPNLEEVFTLLDLASMGVGPLGLTKTDWPSLRLKLMGMIGNAFQGHHFELQGGRRRPPDYEAALARWTELVAEGDIIITFNWDLLHETALLGADKWHYRDGYGFECSDAKPGNPSPTKVLKLHGSVNWEQHDARDCQPSIVHKQDFFSGATDGPGTYLKGAGKSNDGSFLITPSYLKDVSSNRLLLKIWNQAYDALVRATEVTVIGFQLHPSDAPARQLFASALTRNEKLSVITLVSPGGPDHWDGFCFSLGKKRKPIRKKFEDWLKDSELAP
jgi:hypothetical protein